MHRLQELDIDIQGGASALLTIVQNDNLYIANVGNSSALLCTKDSKGGYHVQQVSFLKLRCNESCMLFDRVQGALCFFSELCWGKAMVAYTKPQHRDAPNEVK